MRRRCCLFLILALALGACRKPAPGPPPLALVDGEPITQQALLAARHAQALPVSPSAQALSPSAGALDDAALLEQLID